MRFDYVTEGNDRGFLWAAEGILLLAFVFVLGMLLYIKIHILQPFHVLSEIPYELSKGHLSIDPEENRNRFFGRFLWGLAMLRDHLSDAKAKELKLLKEKKLLLLSISHDIKIPLSAIKLYARALKEEIYESNAKRHEAAEQIEVHVREIEDFVREIISASSEEILSIEVVNSEFYLKDFVEKIRDVYEPKANVILTELLIGIACLVPALRRQANVAAFLALTFFVWLTGDNYFNPSPLGRIESCGCFGELIHFTPLASFIKSLVLWCMATTNLFYEICFSSHA